MNIIMTIMKQEIIKVFKNKKMILSMFMMPLLVVAIYFFMNGLEDTDTDGTDVYDVYFLGSVMEEQTYETGDIILRVVANEQPTYEEFVKVNGVKDSDIIIEQGTESFLVYYDSTNSTVESLVPTVKDSIIRPIAEAMFLASANVQVESFAVTVEDTSSDLEQQNNMASYMLPYLLMLLLFANLVSVVGDSIAGEKERGTLSKQLLAPIDNSQMILGKLLGTTVIGIISSMIYLVVLMGASVLGKKLLNIDIMGFGDFALDAGQVAAMLVGFVFIALVFVAALVFMSSFAKTIKEATNLSMIIYFIIMFAALASMLNVGEVKQIMYAIPIYNFSILMQKVLIGAANATNGLITVCSLSVTFGLLVIASILNFRREKVIC